ncbi:MAG: hypothetical protein LBG52_08100 [Candidatus Peribacteria bacterium]|jgi:hypothetical protein|nr:hypothetical protein [Candidatus Peribacteria bacterium]
MQQLYGEIEKGGTFLPHFYPHDLFVPISASPAWQAAYAYRTTSTNVLQIRNYFHIANNLRSSQLQERTQRLTITQSGRKEFHGVYFFFHEHQLYIIAPRPHGGSNREKFWKTYLPDQQRITRL